MNLSDIYSYIDSKKRAVGGLLSEPGLTIDKYVSQFREDNKDRLNLQANAYPMAGDRTVLNSPHQLDQFRKQLADEGANMAMAAATVWHGSPHKFDKFDSSKIGTGEGAQAYGHGLYLAEAKDTGQSYANKLTNVDGRAISDQIDGRVRYLNMLKQQAKDGDINAAKNIPVMEKSLAELQNQGSLYKVDLPDEHIAKMLDWDQSLRLQHPDVQRKLGEMGYETVEPKGRFMPGKSWKGSAIYEDLVNSGKFTPQDLSTEFSKAGIPGIRYLDGGSRGAGAGSSNYVIFPGNEGLLNILERNGQTVNDLLK
jgi:hypothetical protein